jgi:hypothetical protein
MHKATDGEGKRRFLICKRREIANKKNYFLAFNDGTEVEKELKKLLQNTRGE